MKVIALLMFLGEPAVLKEHTLMPDFGTCLEKNRVASRNSNRATYQCAEVQAIVKDGKIISIASN